MARNPSLLEESPSGVFHELVTTALAEHSVETSELTEFYLVRLLADFVRNVPAAFSAALGVEMASLAGLEPTQRYPRLKELADSTLFLTGVFIDHVEARLAATDYYFELGRRAYLDLGSLDDTYALDRNRFAETYYDLGTRFEDYASVLTTIADRRLFPARQRLMDLYRCWLERGGTRYQRRLAAAGLSVCAGNERTRH